MERMVIKSDVGGLLGINNTWVRGEPYTVGDIDNCQSNRIYTINSDGGSYHYPTYLSYGILLDFESYYRVQMAFSVTNEYNYFRTKKESGWNSWIRF